jgi:ParB-like chromosome segregation protein Spo0J
MIDARDPREMKEWSFSCQAFGSTTPEAFGRLAEDIRARGIRVPVEVDPGGRIICGHERVRAAIRLGLPTVPTRVIDLPDELAYQEYALTDNLLRRQLAPTEQAKAFMLLDRIIQERCRAAGRDAAADKEQGGDPQAVRPAAVGSSDPVGERTRDTIGRAMGLSGRQAGKYGRLAQMPREVGELVDRGALGLDAAMALGSVMRGRPVEEVIVVAKRAAQAQMTRGQARVLARAYVEESRAAAHVAPLSAHQKAVMLTALGSLISLEDVDPVQVVAAYSRPEELTDLAEKMGRAHSVIVRLRHGVMTALARQSKTA